MYSMRSVWSRGFCCAYLHRTISIRGTFFFFTGLAEIAAVLKKKGWPRTIYYVNVSLGVGITKLENKKKQQLTAHPPIGLE